MGYFLTKSGKRQQAKNVFVLSVCYTLASREGDDASCKANLEILRLTFETERKCKYVEMNNPPKEDLLQLLADETRLMSEFDSKGKAPDVFLLFIISHGANNGIMITDKEKTFTTKDVFESLAKLDFKNCLKFVGFSACRTSPLRGKITAKDCRKACKITYFPKIHNLVVFYPTVESTLSRNVHGEGSVFIHKLCSVINNLNRDESLISVVTQVQNEVRNLFKETKVSTVDDTPEVKVFSLSRNFVFNQPSETNRRTLRVNSGFYPWKSGKGPRRSRRAVILHQDNFKELSKIADGLEYNLGFECEPVNMLELEQYDQLAKVIRNRAERVGCIVVVLYGPLEEDPTTKEIIVNWKKKIAVTDVLLGLKGPEYEGVPKILIVINQTDKKDKSPFQENKIPASVRQKIFDATDFSGWLVLVLHDQESVRGLARILHGDEIKTGCLQDELVKLLVDDKRSPNFLNSTLQYKLSFPTSFFVEPDFELLDLNLNPLRRLSFRELFEFSKQRQSLKACIYVMIGVSGAGKTIAMEELANAFEESEQRVLRIQLADLKYEVFLDEMDVVDFLACAAPSYSKDEVNYCLSREHSIVFIDGFSAIDHTGKSRIRKYAKMLRDEKNINVWIATRFYEAEDALDPCLYEECSSCYVKIEPFDARKQDQLVRLVSRGEKNFADLNSRVQEFGEEFLQNPLHLRIAAELDDEENLFDHLIIWHKMVPFMSLSNNSFTNQSEIFKRLLRAVCRIVRKFIKGAKLRPCDECFLYKFGLLDSIVPAGCRKIIHQDICEHLLNMSEDCSINICWNN